MSYILICQFLFGSSACSQAYENNICCLRLPGYTPFTAWQEKDGRDMIIFGWNTALWKQIITFTVNCRVWGSSLSFYYVADIQKIHWSKFKGSRVFIWGQKSVDWSFTQFVDWRKISLHLLDNWINILSQLSTKNVKHLMVPASQMWELASIPVCHYSKYDTFSFWIVCLTIMGLMTSTWALENCNGHFFFTVCS